MAEMFRVIFLCLLVLSAACQQNPSPSQRTVRLNLKYEPLTLDPRKGADLLSAQLHLLLFEGLVRLGPDRSIQPGQAEAFTVSEDGLTYTFHLRDALWSDGSSVTARDFEEAWKAVLDPEFPAPNAHLFYPIANACKAKRGEVPLSAVGIRAVDPRTFVVTLEKPTPYFLDLISFCPFAPVHAKDAGPPYVCNGPFLLKKWKHNRELLLVKNPRYWNPHTRLPDQLHFSRIDEAATVLSLFEQGALDMIGEPFSPIPVEAFAEWRAKGALRKYAIPSTALIGFNTASPLFANPKIRKAFAYAIDRQAITESSAQMAIATGLVPPLLKGTSSAFFCDADRALAVQLFEEGLEESQLTRSDFESASYCYNHAELNHQIAQVVQQQWKEVLGVQIPLERLEQQVLFRKFHNRDYSMGQMCWFSQYNDPMSLLERLQSKDNFSQWEHPEFAALLEESFYAQGEERTQLLERAEALLMEEMPVSPLYHGTMAYMVRREDLVINSVGEILFER